MEKRTETHSVGGTGPGPDGDLCVPGERQCGRGRRAVSLVLENGFTYKVKKEWDGDLTENDRTSGAELFDWRDAIDYV